MKKIIAAAAVATMLAGAAFADISFSYTGKNYFSAKGGNLEYIGANRTDCLAVGLSNDKAGARVDFDVEGAKLVQDEYYAWMNFGLPAGTLQVTAGKWNSRYIDRVKTDAGDLDNEDFEMFKPGVVNPVYTSFGTDSDNLTDGKISTVLAYTLADTLPGTLMVKLGAVTTAEWDSYKDYAGRKTGWKSGFVSEVAYLIKDVVNVNLAVKNSVEKKNASVALFVSPLMNEKLQATAGITFATQNVGEINDFDGKEFAIDLRARYAITDALSVTTMHNISHWYYYNDTYNVDDNYNGMWNQLAVAFKCAENLTVKATYQQYIKDLSLKRDCKDNGYIDEIYFSPALEIKATEKATVTVATRFQWDTVGNNNENFGFVVPVIFSYNY